MKTLSRIYTKMSPFVAVCLTVAWTFAMVAMFFGVSACQPASPKKAPQAACTLEIDNGSPVTVKIPVYVVEIGGRKYYATESSSRFFTLCPMN